MCKFIAKYLCCCVYFERENKSTGYHRKKSGSVSTETNFDKFKSDPIERETIELPDVQDRFGSPQNAMDDTLASHQIRLKERGYDLQPDEPIAQGVFSKVYSVIRESDKLQMAVKIWINREVAESTRLWRHVVEDLWYISTEPLNIHLVRYYSQFIYDSKYSYLLMEYSNGETLHNLLAKSTQPFTESKAKSFFIPIARAINFLHSYRIAHRNIQLENCLIFKQQNNSEVLKISDYCTNRMSCKKEKVVVYPRDAKTITYMSPQILKFYAKHLRKTYKKSDKKIKPFDPFKGDIWALGVCLYYMVMKSPPYGLPPDTSNFDDRTAAKLKSRFFDKCLAKFSENRLVLAKSVNSSISRECVRLLNDLLQTKSNRRIDHFGVIAHNWITGYIENTNRKLEGSQRTANTTQQIIKTN